MPGMELFPVSMAKNPASSGTVRFTLFIPKFACYLRMLQVTYPKPWTITSLLAPMPLTWLTIPRFAVESGYSENAVRAKIKRGQWREGEIWKKAPDGRVHINLEEYQKWVNGQASEPSASRASR